MDNADDNAMSESFFATLECEVLARRRFKTQSEARIATFASMRGFLNPRRRHSALGMMSTMTFEKAHAARGATGANGASFPGVAKSAAVLAADKARRENGGASSTGNVPADLDGACARRRSLRVGGTEGWAPPGPNIRMTLQTRPRTDSTYDWRQDGELVSHATGSYRALVKAKPKIRQAGGCPPRSVWTLRRRDTCDQENGMSYRLPLDLDALRAGVRGGQSFTYLPFYGHSTEPGRITNAVYSQFYPVEFEVHGERFRWAEQWMMAAKARLFGDQDALAAILSAAEPQACKRIGRTVRNYCDDRWNAARFDLVVEGNVAKFGQNALLRDHLLASGDAILVEAAPSDQIWGIGCGRDDPAVHDPLRWRGRNLLGFALVKVRAILRGEIAPQNDGTRLPTVPQAGSAQR